MTIPPAIQPLLDDYIRLIQQHLPDLMGACYLHGSIALGAFDSYSNDVDFVTVVNRPCIPTDTDTLADIHHALARKYPQWIMDGCYLQWHDLGQEQSAMGTYPHVNDHIFHPDGQQGIGLTTWWMLKNRGIALMGVDPKTLAIIIDWNVFIADMRRNMNTYWGQYTHEPRRIISLYTDYGIQWAVLGVLRQFYTFHERDITSKVGAGEYALTCLPQRWHRIIKEAIRIRQRKPESLFRWRIVRMIEAINFLRYIIRNCNINFRDWL